MTETVVSTWTLECLCSAWARNSGARPMWLEGYILQSLWGVTAQADTTGFHANHPHRRTGGLEGDMGAVGVTPRPALRHLAIRVKAKLSVSQSCLEVMVLNLPGLFACALVVRRTHVLMRPRGIESNGVPYHLWWKKGPWASTNPHSVPLSPW